jgi:hypothetical protein
MDINQPKVSGNIQAISDLMEQGGMSDNSDPEWVTQNVDISKYVVLFFGDLGTAERIEALLEWRSLENTAVSRFQLVIFVLGLFHLKMACADAIWHIFLEKPRACDDENSLIHLLALHCPRETGKIRSTPGF